MLIQIDPGSPQPIYEQVTQQVKFAIAAEAILPNELIPSVRELAKELAINPNTISRSFRDLQDQGVVYFRRGTGLAVAEGAAEKCRVERLAIFEDRFRKLYAEAVNSRLEIPEINRIIETVTAEKNILHPKSMTKYQETEK